MKHWEAAKRVVRYLVGTIDEGLFYGKDEEVEVWSYTDASYGSDMETKRGRSGYVFMSAGAAISWGSKLQEVVTLSSTESEYVAMSFAVQEGVYLGMYQREMGVESEKVLLLCDNQSAMKIAKNPVFHNRSKHIGIKFHYVREKVESGEVELHFVPTKAMAADQLTKHVGVKVLVEGKCLMGMIALGE